MARLHSHITLGCTNLRHPWRLLPLIGWLGIFLDNKRLSSEASLEQYLAGVLAIEPEAVDWQCLIFAKGWQ